MVDHSMGGFPCRKPGCVGGRKKGASLGQERGDVKGARELQVGLWKERASSRAGRGASQNHS